MPPFGIPIYTAAAFAVLLLLFSLWLATRARD